MDRSGRTILEIVSKNEKEVLSTHVSMSSLQSRVMARGVDRGGGGQEEGGWSRGSSSRRRSGIGGGDGGELLYDSIAYQLYQINHHDTGQAGEEATLDIPFGGVR